MFCFVFFSLEFKLLFFVFVCMNVSVFETTELEVVYSCFQLRTHLCTLYVCNAVVQCLGAAVECSGFIG